VATISGAAASDERMDWQELSIRSAEAKRMHQTSFALRRHIAAAGGSVGKISLPNALWVAPHLMHRIDSYFDLRRD